MNINFLPAKVKEEIKKRWDDLSAANVARASASIEGETGEAYIVALKNKILLFSRKTGENEFIVREADTETLKAKIRRERFNIFFDLKLKEKDYSIRFSKMEEADLAKIAESLSSDSLSDKVESEKEEMTQKSPETVLESNRTEENFPDKIPEKELSQEKPRTPPRIPAQILLTAAMMFIAKADEQIAKEEDYYIVTMLNYDKKILLKALEYFKTHNFDNFISDCMELSYEQNLCILANMLEIGMKDLKFTAKEQEMIKNFVDQVGIEQSEFKTIKDVLLIKNRTSVMES